MRVSDRPHHTLSSVRFLVTVPVLAAALLLTLWAGLGQAATTAPHVTIIDGDITADTTWSLANSPYQVTRNVTVQRGVTLTVEPGVQVHFVCGATGLTVEGTLLTQTGNTADPPVTTFTGQEQSRTAAPGCWDGLVFRGDPQQPAGPPSILENVTVALGGRSAPRTNLLAEQGASVTIRDSRIISSGGSGIATRQGGVVHVSGTTLRDNTGAAIELSFSADMADPSIEIVAAQDNGEDAVSIVAGSTIAIPVNLENPGLPYIVRGDLRVEASGALTIAPGVEMRFAVGAGLEAIGPLRAAGTAAEPIRFIPAIADQTWDGLFLDSDGIDPATRHELVHVVQSNGGGAFPRANISVDNGAVAHISAAKILSATEDGIFIRRGGVAHVRATHFQGNGGFAVNIADTTANPELHSLTASGNGQNRIAIGGGLMSGQHRWEAAGLDYQIYGLARVAQDGILTVDPGVTVRVEQNQGLEVFGELRSLGTASNPVTFTASSATGRSAGWWDGIRLEGRGGQAVRGLFQHTTVEGGGSRFPGYNLFVEEGQLVVEESTLRESSGHGVYIGDNANRSTVKASRIESNGDHGLFNRQTDRVVLAANNWWGNAAGPATDSGCNPGGAGQKVNGGVAYFPFLTSPDQPVDVTAASQTREMTLTPDRWYAPADGVVRIIFAITLRDGDGRPLSGRKVRLLSDLGTVDDGAVTNTEGKAVATLRSATPGDATVSALLDAESCETARSGATVVTFTDFDPGVLDVQAPYFVGNASKFQVQPIIAGLRNTYTLEIRNPNSTTLNVNLNLGIARFGVGLGFANIGSLENETLAPNESRRFEFPFTPTVSGHYCLEINLSTSTVPSGRGAAAVTESFDWFDNQTVREAGLSEKKKQDMINRVEKGWSMVGWLGWLVGGPPKNAGEMLQGDLLGHQMNLLKETGVHVATSLAMDPPRQDYNLLAVTRTYTITTIQPGTNRSPAHAQALNDYYAAYLHVLSTGQAASLSLDRYTGASNARDLLWASQQAQALHLYSRQMGEGLLVYADAIDALLQVLANDGLPETEITQSDLLAAQQALAQSGFPAGTSEYAASLGMSQAELDAVLARLLADPLDYPAQSVQALLAELAADARALAPLMIDQTNFPDAGGGARQADQTSSSRLARVYANSTPFQLGNPTGATATIDLRVRPVSLPSDWLATVTPMTATLQAGEVISGYVTLYPGSAAPQGFIPRVAVEGYIGSQRIGGLVVDTVIPLSQEALNDLRVYLPAVNR